jgi:hypothetical protein
MSETKTSPAAKTAPKTAPAKATPAPAPKPAKVTGARAYAEKPVTPAMANFTRWIAREFPELHVDSQKDSRDARLVMIASKAYGFFQSSDLNK